MIKRVGKYDTELNYVGIREMIWGHLYVLKLNIGIYLA